MIFNSHSELVDTHALLSPSNYHWINDDRDKLIGRIRRARARVQGVELHEYARIAIKLRRLQAGNDTVSMYINDAIGYDMIPEQILFYSKNCYGTADAISFREALLRIHDLKTGKLKTSVWQLYLYAALFCLEYNINPFDIDTELRIYQNDEVRIYEADPNVISHLMDVIGESDEIVREEFKQGTFHDHQ